MKSRKKLKKRINKAFNTLYQDILFYEAFTINANSDAARKLMDKAIETEKELISRVNINEGKHVKGRVKMYFKKLEEDLKSKIEGIDKELSSLS